MLLQGPIIADAEKRLAFLLAILHYFARLTTVVMGSGLRHGVHTAGGAGGLIGFRCSAGGGSGVRNER